MTEHDMVFHIKCMDQGVSFLKSIELLKKQKLLIKPTTKAEQAKEKVKKNKPPHHLIKTIWKPIRDFIVLAYGGSCMKCGTTPSKNNIHVDHIKPKSIHPEIKYNKDNLQVLCKSCNFEKGNKNETDYRPRNWNELLNNI